MPPLTECWSKPSEEASNRWFSYDFLATLASGRHPPETLRGMWGLCLANAPNLPIRAFHRRDEMHVFPSAGPNGALLASMVAVQRRRGIHLWVNDNAERYPTVNTGSAIGSETGVTDTLAIAARLLRCEALGTSLAVRGWFPETIPRLVDWVDRGAGKNTKVRIGFLDPDNYMEGHAQVSSYDHRQWLRALAAESRNAVSAMFSGCQNRGGGNAARNGRLALFHADETSLYPQSIVFEYGNFQTGVKVRWPAPSINRVAADLRDFVVAAWRGWHPSMGPLTVHLNGQAGN